MSKDRQVSILKERLTELWKRYGSDTLFAEAIGVPRQTLNYWLSGKRTPDAKSLIAISEKLDISTDWLLGLSDTKKKDPTTQAACEYTGLSEKAIEFIHDKINHSRKFKFGLEYLLTSNPLDALIMIDAITVISETRQSFEYLKTHFDEVYSDKTPEQKEVLKILMYVDNENEDGSVRLAPANAPAFFQNKAKTYFNKIISKLLEDGES